MKEQLIQLLQTSVTALQDKGLLSKDLPINIQMEHARDKQFGDYASNLAMVLAKLAKIAPRELAKQLIDHTPSHPDVVKMEIAGPGFINFYIKADAIHKTIKIILDKKEKYGQSTLGEGKKIYIEYVSANPNGPLHVGHGRGAAYGDACANLLDAAGYTVHREYYVNDAGRQMNILTVSIWLRYLETQGMEIPFPSNGYKGEYVKPIANKLFKIHGDKFLRDKDAIFSNIREDAKEDGSGDKEAHVDDLIVRAKYLLGEENFVIIFNMGLDNILSDIREDLAEFGVRYNNWFSEKQLFTNGSVEKSIETLKANGHTYMREGNLWFNATAFGDEKDRVLIRANGVPTYFASDVAYHYYKFQQADKIIDIFGADHHGYIPRIKAVLTALGVDVSRFEAHMVQFAILHRGGERVQMSTRSGSFVTLRELRDEVGNDAARFFYVMRKHEQHMDFDLELAKSHSNENPVYYIQYAHARICSVFRQLIEKNIVWDQEQGLAGLNLLALPEETSLMEILSRYPETVEKAAMACEPHQIPYFLKELATQFHGYYNNHQFLVEDAALRNARLTFIQAIAQVIVNGLTLIGVSAPKTM